MSDEVITVIVIVVYGGTHVSPVVEYEEGDGACYQHVTADVKLLVVQQQWIRDVPATRRGGQNHTLQYSSLQIYSQK